MFNKTNESTGVETAMATSALAMVFIPFMARPDTGYNMYHTMLLYIFILWIMYDIMTRHRVILIFRYI